MAGVQFRDVTKVYDDGVQAVSSLNLEIGDGEFLVFVGPSGCGKTTALRMVGGLEEISSGTIEIGDRAVNDLGPRERDIAMVFQNYALYPHMSIFDNIAFPLQAQGVPKAEIRERVQSMAEILDLQPHLKRRPKQLSGGQRQRVAMGRALVRKPKVFLMDEPLSNLDAKLRVEMRGEITRLQEELGVTTIYVTHDQVEAMTMGDRIAVMRGGVLQQHGQPSEVYDNPANLFVAQFIGSPAMNLFTAQVVADGDNIALDLGTERVQMPNGFLRTVPGLSEYVGRDLAVGIRPEQLYDRRRHTESIDVTLQAHVVRVEMLGPERHVYANLPARPVVTREVIEVISDADGRAEDEIAKHVGTDSARLIARFDADAQITVGETLSLGLAAAKLRFFSLESGTAIR